MGFVGQKVASSLTCAEEGTWVSKTSTLLGRITEFLL